MSDRSFAATSVGGTVLPARREASNPNTVVPDATAARFALCSLAACLFTLLPTAPARAGLIYNGSQGEISFGVTNYGGGSQFTPK